MRAVTPDVTLDVSTTVAGFDFAEAAHVASFDVSYAPYLNEEVQSREGTVLLLIKGGRIVDARLETGAPTAATVIPLLVGGLDYFDDVVVWSHSPRGALEITDYVAGLEGQCVINGAEPTDDIVRLVDAVADRVGKVASASNEVQMSGVLAKAVVQVNRARTIAARKARTA